MLSTGKPVTSGKGTRTADFLLPSEHYDLLGAFAVLIREMATGEQERISIVQSAWHGSTMSRPEWGRRGGMGNTEKLDEIWQCFVSIHGNRGFHHSQYFQHSPLYTPYFMAVPPLNMESRGGRVFLDSVHPCTPQFWLTVIHCDLAMHHLCTAVSCDCWHVDCWGCSVKCCHNSDPVGNYRPYGGWQKKEAGSAKWAGCR